VADQAEAAKQPSLIRMFRGTTGTVFILLCLMYFIEYIDRVNLSIAQPLIKEELHLTNTEMGFALSAFGYCYAAFQIIGGFAGDRFGARATLGGLGVLWALGTALVGFTGGLAGLVAARVLVGLGEAGTLPTASRVITSWVPSQRRGFAQGFTHSASRLAGTVTPPLVAFLLIPIAGWRGAFIILGGVSFAWVLVWIFYFRNDPRQHKGVTADELGKLTPYAKHGGSLRTVPWATLIARMLPVTAVFFCHAWTLWLYLTWLPGFFSETYGLPLKETALFSSGVFLAGVIGDTVGGLVTDAIHRWTGDVVKARRNTIIIGFGCSFLCLLGVIVFHDMTIVTVALALAFFFLEMTEAPIWAVPIDVAPKYVGFASGIMSTAAGLAATISPVAFGYVTDLTGSQRIPFLMSIALLLAGIPLSFLVRPDRKIVDKGNPDEAEREAARAPEATA
jgi:sugar phosphate permease